MRFCRRSALLIRLAGPVLLICTGCSTAIFATSTTATATAPTPIATRTLATTFLGTAFNFLGPIGGLLRTWLRLRTRLRLCGSLSFTARLNVRLSLLLCALGAILPMLTVILSARFTVGAFATRLVARAIAIPTMAVTSMTILWSIAALRIAARALWLW